VKLIASDPVLPPVVKQHGRPATTRLRSIRAKVAQMANSFEPSHVRVGVIFRPQGRKSSVIIRYFPSVRTEIYTHIYAIFRQ